MNPIFIDTVSSDYRLIDTVIHSILIDTVISNYRLKATVIHSILIEHYGSYNNYRLKEPTVHYRSNANWVTTEFESYNFYEPTTSSISAVFPQPIDDSLNPQYTWLLETSIEYLSADSLHNSIAFHSNLAKTSFTNQQKNV